MVFFLTHLTFTMMLSYIKSMSTAQIAMAAAAVLLAIAGIFMFVRQYLAERVGTTADPNPIPPPDGYQTDDGEVVTPVSAESAQKNVDPQESESVNTEKA